MLCLRRRARRDAGVRRLYRRLEHPRCGVCKNLPRRPASWRTCSATTACTPSPRRGVIESSRVPNLAPRAAKRSERSASDDQDSRSVLEDGGHAPQPQLVQDALRRLLTHAGSPTPPSPAPHSQNSASRSASRSVAGLASGEATSATSVRSIGAKPSFAVSTRWSAWIAISERMLRPMPAATAAWMPARLERGIGHVPGCGRRFPAHGSRPPGRGSPRENRSAAPSRCWYRADGSCW